MIAYTRVYICDVDGTDKNIPGTGVKDQKQM